jgi:hypothetical protein
LNVVSEESVRQLSPAAQRAQANLQGLGRRVRRQGLQQLLRRPVFHCQGGLRLSKILLPFVCEPHLFILDLHRNPNFFRCMAIIGERLCYAGDPIR